MALPQFTSRLLKYLQATPKTAFPMVTYPLGASKESLVGPFYEVELSRLASADQYFSSLLEQGKIAVKGFHDPPVVDPIAYVSPIGIGAQLEGD